MSVSVTVNCRERLCSVNINMFPLLPILPPPTIHLIVLYFQARRGQGWVSVTQGVSIWPPDSAKVLHHLKRMLFFFNKSFFHTGYTLNIVKVSISRSQVTTFQEQNPSLVSLSPGATRMRFCFKIPPAILYLHAVFEQVALLCIFSSRSNRRVRARNVNRGATPVPPVWQKQNSGNMLSSSKWTASWFLHELTRLR